MSAAAAAAARGHAVVLYERGPRLGGQLRLAAAPPGRGELAVLADDLARQLELRGVRVELGCEVDGRVLDDEGPDAIVLATGATPVVPPIPGATLPHVVHAAAVLAGEAAEAARRVAVVGGGAVGVETALFLAARDPGARVALLELTGELGASLGRTTRWTMLRDLAERGVLCRTGVRVLEIRARSVRIEASGRAEEIPAEAVVLAGGARSHDPLQPLARGRGIPYRVIGDAAAIGTALDAIHQGFLAGSAIDGVGVRLAS